MRLGQLIRACACLVAAAVLLAGCGSSDDSGGGSGPVESRPAPAKAEFPKADGKSLAEVLESAEPAALVVSQAAKVFNVGENRFPFGVFHKDGTQVSDADVALYFAKVPKVDQNVENEAAKGADARAEIKALEEPATGPFPARLESIETEPAFRAVTTSDDPHAATAVYVTDVDFPSDGEWRIAAVLKEDGKLSATLLPSVIVGGSPRVPQVGDQAPLIHTPTPEDVGGDLSKITTRIPPDTQNRVDYADALGKEPILLLFATPQFCQSRVCGPVVDVAEQVKQQNEGKAAFIHMEIYNDNDPNKGTRPQVRAFRLPSEPWLFAIDRSGTIVDVVEGAFGIEEMERALKAATGE